MAAPTNLAKGAPHPGRAAVAAEDTSQQLVAEQQRAGLAAKAAKTPGITAEDMAAVVAQPETPGLFGRIMGGISSITEPFFMLDIYTMMGAGIASFVLAPVGFLGRITGNQALQSFGEKFTNVVRTPLAVANATTLGDGVSGALRNTAKQLGEGRVADALRSAATPLEGMEANAGRGLRFVADTVSTQMGNVVKQGPQLERMAARQAMKASVARGGLAELLKHVEGLLGAHAIVGNPDMQKRGADFAVQAGEADVKMNAAGHMGVIRKSVAALNNIVGNGGTAPGIADASKHMEALKESAHALKAVHAGTNNADVKEGVRAIRGVAAQLEKQVTSMVRHTNSAALLRDIPGAVRALPQTLGKTTLYTAGFNTAIATNMAVRTTGTVADVRGQLRALREMCTDMEGKKVPVSNMHALFGDVPEPVKAARNEIWKQLGPQAIIEAVSGGVDVGMLTGRIPKMFLFPMIAAQMGGMAIQSIFAKPASIAKDYAFLRKAYDAGADIHPSAYAALLVSASPEIGKLGLDNMLVQEVAKECLAERLSPAAVLQESTNGKLAERAARLQDKLAAQGHKPGDKTPEAAAADAVATAEKKHAVTANDTKAGEHANQNHASAPQGAATPATAQPVVGKFTQHVVGQKAAELAGPPVMPQIAGMTPSPLVNTPHHVAAVNVPYMPVAGVA